MPSPEQKKQDGKRHKGQPSVNTIGQTNRPQQETAMQVAVEMEMKLRGQRGN